MIRRLNYTRRRPIRREDVVIRVSCSDSEPATFDATLALARYRFPPDARVFVEAYRQASWQRFDFGTAGSPQPPENRRLTAFGSADGVLFRVKVVEAATAGDDSRPARILGHADRIRPRMREQTERRAFLPVDPGDFRDEVWRLEFDDSDAPVLKISRHLVPDWRALTRTQEFAVLVLPAVFRSVLTRIILVDRCTEPDDAGDWRAQWLRFAFRLPGVAGPPPDPQEGDVDHWIDEAVEAFCRQTQMPRRFRDWWEREQ